MVQAYLYAQPSIRAAHVQHSIILIEVKLAGQSYEITSLDTGHGIYKLVQLCFICIKFSKEVHIALFLPFSFVLRSACPQTFIQIAPELVQPVVAHLEYAAHIAFLILVEE